MHFHPTQRKRLRGKHKKSDASGGQLFGTGPSGQKEHRDGGKKKGLVLPLERGKKGAFLVSKTKM